MRSALDSNSPGVTVTSCMQATTPNVPTPPKRQPLLGQVYGLTRSLNPFGLRSSIISFACCLAARPASSDRPSPVPPSVLNLLATCVSQTRKCLLATSRTAAPESPLEHA